MVDSSTFVEKLTLSERLVRTRRSAGFTQETIAPHVGKSERSVAAYEAGKEPGFAVVSRWGTVTGTPITYFDDAITAAEVTRRKQRTSPLPLMMAA